MAAVDVYQVGHLLTLRDRDSIVEEFIVKF